MKITRKLIMAAALVGLFEGSAHSGTIEALTLKAYMDQISAGNQSYVSYERKRESAQMQVSENDVTLSPSAYANAEAAWDSKLPANALMSYDRLDTQNYSFGVKQENRYGTSVDLGYYIDHTNYINMSQGALCYYDARPVLKVTQQLWKNGFGKTTRAGLNATEAKWQAEKYSALDGISSLKIDAETAYWSLVAARETVKVQTRSMEQAKIIFDYVSQMEKKNLYEKADVIQAKASLEASKLDLKAAQDDERAALRQFNSLRSMPQETPVETLEEIGWLELENLRAPASHGSKASVKAAEYSVKNTEEQTKSSKDANEPSLELSGSYAVNGRGEYFSETAGNSYSSGRPTTKVGIQFSVPFDRGAVADVKQGLDKQFESSKLAYSQKLADQENEWNDLKEKISDAGARLKITKDIVSVQKEKLDNERARLRRGRTTTYQVLQFEQDYLQTEISYIKAALNVLTLRAKAAVFVY